MSSSFNLPNSFRPGTDRISKEITRDPAVINIITKALLNVEDEYLPESSDWPNGTHSDLVLVPKSIDSGLSPIIVEFQQDVNKKFMKRAVGYCLQAYKRFEVEPVLLVICIKSLCVTIKNGLENCDDLPCYAAPCDYWANHCYIVDESSIKNYITSDSGLESKLNPFAAYGLFLTTQATSVNQASRKLDETTEMLYRISQNAYAKILDQDASVLEELKNLNDLYYKQYEKVLDMVSDDGLPRSVIKEYVSQSIKYSIEQKRKFDEITSENCLSENQDVDEPIEIKDAQDKPMDFIEIFKKERADKGMTMDWKLCLAEGKKRFGWKYKNGESLRAQFAKYKKKKMS